MPSAGFEPAIPTFKLLQTYSLGRMATGIGRYYIRTSQYSTAIKIHSYSDASLYS